MLASIGYLFEVLPLVLVVVYSLEGIVNANASNALHTLRGELNDSKRTINTTAKYMINMIIYTITNHGTVLHSVTYLTRAPTYAYILPAMDIRL